MCYIRDITKHGAPLRGIEPRPRRWKRRILATRPQGIWPLENWQLFVTNINMTHFFVMKLHCVLSNFHGIHDYLKIWCTPLRGIEPRPRRWKRRILATRPQGIGKRDDLLKPDDEEESFVFSTLQWLRLFVFLNFLHLSGHILAGLSGVKRTAIFFPQIEVTWVYDL